jgi:hypothetical protein
MPSVDGYLAGDQGGAAAVTVFDDAGATRQPARANQDLALGIGVDMLLTGTERR